MRISDWSSDVCSSDLTLVNSLVGRRVTEPGVLRPTTRSPVLVHNPADAGWFGQDRILPDLERTARATGDPSALQLVPATTIPAGPAVLHAPDIHSRSGEPGVGKGRVTPGRSRWARHHYK